ncbi:MAG: helix-turn-helix transcriptional regulator [Bacilli bacterium]|nr:helix-turn-helix transcriptional regulator [Bacilli bacterium]
MKERFSSYIAALRKSRGLTQRELGEQLGFTPQGISRFESLDSGFDLSLLSKLLQILNISLSDVEERKKEGTHYTDFDFDLNALPRRIKSRRLAARLSQSELASKIGSTSRSIRSYENGESLPSYQSLEKIAEACGCLVADFFVDLPLQEETDVSSSEETPQTEKTPILVSAPIPLWKRKSFLFSALGGLLTVSIAVATPLAIRNLSSPGDDKPSSSFIHPSTSEDSLSPSPSSSETPSSSEGPISSSEEPISSSKSQFQPHHPAYLEAEVSTHELTYVGQTVNVRLYDPDGIFSFEDLAPEDCVLYPADGIFGGVKALEFSIESLGKGCFTVTLISGRTGAMELFGATVRGIGYYNFFYLHYITGEQVTIVPSGAKMTNAIFVDKDNFYQETTVILSHTTFARGRGFVLNGSETLDYGLWSGSIWFHEIISPGTCNESHTIVGTSGTEIEFYRHPTQNQVTGLMGVKVRDDIGEYVFAFRPWIIHLIDD